MLRFKSPKPYPLSKLKLFSNFRFISLVVWAAKDMLHKLAKTSEKKLYPRIVTRATSNNKNNNRNN